MTISKPPSVALFLSVLLAVGGCAPNEEAERQASAEAQTASSPPADADEIRRVLERQVNAWNSGSIEGFMDGYAQSDTLRYASGGDVWYGWAPTLRRYRQTYRDEGLMGTLSFEDLDVWMLSEAYALVFGRWHLSRSEEYANAGGLFTLIARRLPEGWRIVHDHTSSGGTPESPQEDSENE